MLCNGCHKELDKFMERLNHKPKDIKEQKKNHSTWASTSYRR